MLADPIGLNSRLGPYTNFVNLLDLCGVAVPAACSGWHAVGVTLLAPGAMGCSPARPRFHAASGLPLGATGRSRRRSRRSSRAATGEIALAVVGAHLSGMPLNGELTPRRALLEAAPTAPDYRALRARRRRRPSPASCASRQDEGAGIEIEIWALPAAGFGRFVAAVPPPLAIGTVALADGRKVKGFLVEADGEAGARDISEYRRLARVRGSGVT